jgi:hypothetical protein
MGLRRGQQQVSTGRLDTQCLCCAAAPLAWRAEEDSLPGFSVVGIPQSETRGNYTIANYVITPTNYSL